ncbi:MAG: MBL fold metallo-hydrolase [Anaerolineae bacterium]|nr:MBL fold metallo-hydrolase [Anaerolineae bacterium]
MATRSGTNLIKQISNLKVAPGCLAIWGLGQMGVVLKGSSQKIVYVDPILTDVVTRRIPGTAGHFDRDFEAPLQPHEISNADYVFCTHEHLDHTDPLTLGPLAVSSPQALFITSGWASDLLDDAGIPAKRRIVPPTEQGLELPGISAWAIPAAHYQVETDPVKGQRWLSFQIACGDTSFFHSGDTLLYPGYLEAIRRLPNKADVAMLSANGRDAMREAEGVMGNMLPEEAVALCSDAGWDMLLGGHNDLFIWNTLPAGSLLDAARGLKNYQKIHILQPGELYYYVR